MLLVIQSFGAKIAVKDGLFEVSTIENQTYIKREYAVSEVQSIWVQHGCSLTNAAIVLAMDNDIDFLLLNHFGVPVGRFMPIRPNSIVSIQRAQLEAAQGADGFEFVKSWISQKMNNQMDLLRRRSQHHNSKAKHNALIIKSIAQINQQYQNLLALQSDSTQAIAEQLRGMEGTAGRAYFAGLSELLPKKYPFEKRTYQNPTDAFNSCLNYGYAILYSKVESVLIKAGLSPYAGFLHRDDFQFKSMVYDFVEPYRTWAEDPIMNIFLHRALNNSHLQEEEGKTMLSTLGRKLITDAIVVFLQEKIVYQNTQQEVNRERLLLLKAQNFATQLNQSDCKIIAMPTQLRQAA